MSTELKNVESTVDTLNDMRLVSFFGGVEQGRSVQLTQLINGGNYYVVLNEQMAQQLVTRLSEWLEGR